MRGPIRHEFSDWKRASGFCEVHIFEPTTRSGGLPVVILTEPNDNHGPSVTNTLEQIAAEVLARYLPEQDGLEPPCLLVEHYPDRQPRRHHARYHDKFFGETFDLVSFASWRRVLRWDRDQLRQALGTPDWKHTDRTTVEQLIGGPLPWPACTCQITAREQVVS
jgi:hypothetical protein